MRAKAPAHSDHVKASRHSDHERVSALDDRERLSVRGDCERFGVGGSHGYRRLLHQLDEISFASSVIWSPLRSRLLTGHFFSASSARRLNVASSTPGTRPSVARCILLMDVPSSEIVARVLISSGG